MAGASYLSTSGRDQGNLKASIRLLKERGYSAPQQLLRILLLALGPSEMAMAVSMDGVTADAATLVATATSTSPVSNIESYKTMIIAILLTLLCGAIGICFYFRFALGVARGESFAQNMNKTFHQVLDELEYRMGWGIYETKEETLQEKRRRYLDSEMCEVSDDEYWRHIHYGPLGLTNMTKVKKHSFPCPMTRCCAAPIYHLS